MLRIALAFQYRRLEGPAVFSSCTTLILCCRDSTSPVGSTASNLRRLLVVFMVGVALPGVEGAGVAPVWKLNITFIS